MIGTLVDILSWALLVTGAAFYVIGAIGIARMPDVFTRIHAASVSDVMGLGLMTVGMILQAGFTLVAVKLVFIILIVWVTGAVATHALARAALHDGVWPLLAGPDGRLKPTDVIELFPELHVRIVTPTRSETMDERSEEGEGGDDEESLRRQAEALGIDHGGPAGERAAASGRTGS